MRTIKFKRIFLISLITSLRLMLFACDEDEYIGEFLVECPEDRRIYVSKDGESIVVAYFFLEPIFIIPLEQPVEAEKTPEQVLAELL